MPWSLLQQLPEWRVDWAHTGRGGVCIWRDRRILLDPGMTAVRESCVLAHEATHAARGPFPRWLASREEEAVSQVAARYLIPLELLVAAVVWSLDPHEIAEELWVDVPTLEARVRGLTAAEWEAVGHQPTPDHLWITRGHA